MTGVEEKRKNKLIYKIVSIGVIALIQAVSFLVIMGGYMYFFPIFGKDVNILVDMWCFILCIFPIAVVLGNSITMFTSKRIFIGIFTVVALALLIYYWGGGLSVYPFKIGFAMAMSIILYLLGVVAISRIRDWIS